MHTYRDLVVWQKAIVLAKLVYELTEKFPHDERFGLISQMRRAVVSIASNIAEGKLRGSKKELRQFLLIAFAPGGELETQIEIAKQLAQTKELDYIAVASHLNEVMRMLNVMISKAGAPSA